MSRLPLVLRLAGRGLRRSPLFFLTAALTLGVGIGAFLAAASLGRGLLLSPVPGIGEPRGLVRLELEGASSAPNLADLGAATTTLAATGSFLDVLVDLDAGGEPGRGLVNLVSDGYFATLGLEPLLGTLALGAPDEVVLGAHLWEERFGRDPGVLGRTIRLNGWPVTVVGVAPPGFAGTFRVFRVEAWASLALAPRVAPGFDLEDRSRDRLEAIARLAPGTTMEQAGQEVAALAARLREGHPEANRELVARLAPLTGFDDDFAGAVVGLVATLLGLALALLAVAVGNAAGALAARSASRAREAALHVALGAGRRQLLSYALAEGLLIAFAGSGVGLTVAWVIARAWDSGTPALPVRLALDLSPDGSLAILAFAVSLFVGVTTGLPAAVRALRTSPRATLAVARADTPERARTRGVMVALQVAGAVVLLTVGGLFLRALSRQAAAGPGIDARGVAVAQLVDFTATGAEPAELAVRMTAVRDRVAATPGVHSVAWTSDLPFLSVANETARPRGDGTEPPAECNVSVVSPELFSLLRIPLLAGRPMAATDAPDAPRVAWVDAALADRWWPAGDPTGAVLTVEDEDYRVAGVVGSVRRGGRALPAVYVPLAQHPARRMHLLARGEGGAPVGDALRQALQTAEPTLAPPAIAPLEDLVALAFLPQRVAARAGLVLGGVGLLLAVTGLYALLAFLVAERRHGLAVRVALGATPSRVAVEASRQGLVQAVAGWVLGLAVAVLVGRALSSLLLGVSGADPLVLGASTLGVVLALAPAFWLSARKVLGLDLARLLAGR